jgi:hypothetical protein
MKHKPVCMAKMQSGYKCLLLKGHKGHHRNLSVWYCDICGKPQSCLAYRDSDGMAHCWMCVELPRRTGYGMDTLDRMDPR